MPVFDRHMEEELTEEREEVEVIRAAEPEEEESGVPEDVLAVLAQLGESAPSVDVFRRNQRTRRYEFVDNLPAESFSLDVVKDSWGGGEYQVRPKNPAGQYIKGTTRTFTIAGAPREPSAEPDPAPTPDPLAGQLGTLRDLMQGIRDDLRERRASGGTDPLELGIKLAGQIQQANTPLLEQLIKLSTSKREEARDPLEMLDHVLEVADRVRAGSSGESSGVVNQLGRELITLFRESRGAAAARPTPGPRGAPPVTPNRDPSEPSWVPFMAQSVPSLLQLARAGRDPNTYAVVLLDQLPEPAVEYLGRLLGEGDSFRDSFYLRFPETAADHRYWFDQLFDALRAELVEEPEPEASHED